MSTFRSATTARSGTRAASGRAASGRAVAGVIAATVALTVSAAPAGATKPKPTPKPKGCTPGDIKQGKDGWTYVCDTHGTWVMTIDLTAGGQGTVSAGGRGAGAATAARAEAKGSGPAKVTCPLNGGATANPGDKLDHVQYTKDAKGHTVSIQHTYYVCGSDGMWHETARAVSHPTVTVAAALPSTAVAR